VGVEVRHVNGVIGTEGINPLDAHWSIQSVRTQRASSVNEPPHQDRTTKKMRLLSHPQKLLS
jgi:hypothetical protein